MCNWIRFWFVLRTFDNFSFFFDLLYNWFWFNYLNCFHLFNSLLWFSLSCNSDFFFLLTHFDSCLNHLSFFIFLLLSHFIMKFTFFYSFSHEFFLFSFVDFLGDSKCFFRLGIHFFIFILLFGEVVCNVFWSFRNGSFLNLIFSKLISFHFGSLDVQFIISFAH